MHPYLMLYTWTSPTTAFMNASEHLLIEFFYIHHLTAYSSDRLSEQFTISHFSNGQKKVSNKSVTTTTTNENQSLS